MLRYLGVISGTSMDAIDVVTLVVEDGQLYTDGFYSHEHPTDLRKTLEELCHPENQSIENELECAASADVQLGKLIATAINNALDRQNLSTGDIIAIGSHGQNIRHRPDGDHPFSLQIGAPAFIAEQTGITTVANFRMSDIAAGGQGAPLAPGFHQAA
ncbi:MAG: anhydro-N-acetylmuramic acid kinase, partial [Oleiphilaceae bacterium]|nr:anhydro-N-acetylmuramic acid kinase [Oleiphilaceae bacterium]